MESNILLPLLAYQKELGDFELKITVRGDFIWISVIQDQEETGFLDISITKCMWQDSGTTFSSLMQMIKNAAK